MRRRNPRGGAKLDTQIKEVTLFGSSRDYASYSCGYIIGSELTSAPLPNAVSSLELGDVTDAEVFAEAGKVVFATATAGKCLVRSQADDSLSELTCSSSAKPFGIYAVNADGTKSEILCLGDELAILNTSEENVALSFSANAGVLHCGRLFLSDEAEAAKVRWSGLRFDEWETEAIEGSGWCSLDYCGGKIVHMAEFGDNILCLRETGITIIRALGDPRNFRVAPSQSYIPSGFARGGGGVLGGKYYYCCEDGVWAYDGESAKRVFRLDETDAEYNSLRVLPNGKLYVNCTVGEEPRLAIYDPQSGDRAMVSGALGAYALNGEIYCVKGGYVCKFTDGENGERVWKSETITYPYAALREVVIEGEGNISVKAVCGDYSRVFASFGTNRADMRGVNYSFEVTGVGKLTALYARFEEEK